MIYKISERFKSLQGEGVYAGTPMAFIRFVGCSVGKRICHHCDTDFDQMHNWRGGGEFEHGLLGLWTQPYQHICFTGGEPLNQDLEPLIEWFSLWKTPNAPLTIHVETSGTVELVPFIDMCARHGCTRDRLWICVSPKPGYLNESVMEADEVKVIVPGLGNGEGWPTIDQARLWAELRKTVFLQPRNAKLSIDQNNLRIVQDIIRDNPQFRLSVQMHKILGVQ